MSMIWNLSSLLRHTGISSYSSTWRSSCSKGRAISRKRIKQAEAPLDSCNWVIDCTKIKMTQAGGHDSIQRIRYSGQKRMHSLIHKTITTFDTFTGWSGGRQPTWRYFLEGNLYWGETAFLSIYQRTAILFVCRFRIHASAVDADFFSSHGVTVEEEV